MEFSGLSAGYRRILTGLAIEIERFVDANHRAVQGPRDFRELSRLARIGAGRVGTSIRLRLWLRAGGTGVLASAWIVRE